MPSPATCSDVFRGEPYFGYLSARMRPLVLPVLAGLLVVGCGEGASGADVGSDADRFEAEADGEATPDVGEEVEGGRDAGEDATEESLEVAEDDGSADVEAEAEVGDAGPAFESFRLWEGRGPCRPDGDCEGFIELDYQGRLRVDRFNETPVTVREATVSETDRVVAIAILTDPDLIAALDLPTPPCGEPPTDIFESMTLVVGAVTYFNTTPWCMLSPIDAARRTMDNLAATYLPP